MHKVEQHSATDASVLALHYRQVDVTDAGTVAAVLAAADREPAAGASAEPVAAYLALPTGLFPAAVTALGAVGLPKGSRIVRWRRDFVRRRG